MNKTLMISVIAVQLLLFSAPCIMANDGTYYTNGNQLVPLQETDISVRREVLTISLMDNGYARVDVCYEFWNPGKKAKRVLMGFEADPPYNDDYRFHPDGAHPNIRDFVVEMNDRRLAYRTAACVRDSLPLQLIDTSKRYWVFDNNDLYDEKNRMDDDVPFDINAGISFSYVYYFDAEFQPGLNRVHHTYTYRMSIIVETPYVVDYKLTPAGRWAGGKIEDFTLVIRADSTAKHFVIRNLEKIFPGAQFSVSKGAGKIRKTIRNRYYIDTIHEFSLRNGAVQIHLTDFHPQEELRIDGAGIHDCYDGKDVFYFGATYDRSFGEFLYYLDNEKVVPADKEFRYRVARNLPYAHRGHVFKDKRLREYFESLWWYMPDPDYKDSDADFTEVDRKYIKSGKEPKEAKDNLSK